MDDLHFIQKFTLVVYVAIVLFSFLFSWWKRKKVTLGSLEVTIFPAVVLLSVVYSLTSTFSHNVFLLTAGFTMYLIGVILNVLSFSHLGWVNSDDFWLGRFEDKQRSFITTGPYKYIRHPIFISLVLQYLGLVMVFLHLLSIALWVFALLIGVMTSLYEEKFMRNTFSNYEGYMRRTGRFFPKI